RLVHTARALALMPKPSTSLPLSRPAYERKNRARGVNGVEVRAVYPTRTPRPEACPLAIDSSGHCQYGVRDSVAGGGALTRTRSIGPCSAGDFVLPVGHPSPTTDRHEDACPR